MTQVGFFHERYKNVDFVFVDHPSYPRPGGMYADSFGAYGDNIFRFSLLSIAGLEAPLLLELEGGERVNPNVKPGQLSTFGDE